MSSSRDRWSDSARCTAQAAASAASVLDLDDPAVVHVGDPVAEVEDAVVVGDDHDGAVGPDGRLAEQFHDGQAGLVVERRGRLVADQQARLVDQGAGRSPRAAAGRRRAASAGSRSCPPCRAAPGPRGPCATAFALRPAGDDQRDRRVLGRRQGRQQVVLLEDEADPPGAEPGLAAVAHRRDLAAPKIVDRPRVAVEDPGDHRQQGRLAAAGRPDDQRHLRPCTRPSRPPASAVTLLLAAAEVLRSRRGCGRRPGPSPVDRRSRSGQNIAVLLCNGIRGTAGSAPEDHGRFQDHHAADAQDARQHADQHDRPAGDRQELPGGVERQLAPLAALAEEAPPGRPRARSRAGRRRPPGCRIIPTIRRLVAPIAFRAPNCLIFATSDGCPTARGLKEPPPSRHACGCNTDAIAPGRDEGVRRHS